MCGEGVPFHTEGRIWDGAKSPSRKSKFKKLNFSLEMACFGIFWAAFFVRVLVRKMLNFPPEVVI